MKQSMLVSLALGAGTAMADSLGRAVVVNSCKYDVHLCDVPAAGGGYEEHDQILSPGDTWSQQWTQLSNAQGWSIKLSKSASLANIMQYEYTHHNDGVIWYDLSDVDGNPWDGNWEITSSTPLCQPKQQAYRYSTDDAYGMQACLDSATITVTLCSGEDQNNSTASSISSSVAAQSTVSNSTLVVPTVSVPTFSASSSTQTTTTTPSPAPSSTTARYPQTSHSRGNHIQAAVEQDSSTTVVSPTTFATSTTAAVEKEPGVTVYEVETAVVTAVVTAVYTAPSRIKRHEHHAGHSHE